MNKYFFLIIFLCVACISDGGDIGFSNQYVFFSYGLHDENLHLFQITRYSNTLSNADLGELSTETQLELAHHQFEVYLGVGDSVIDYNYRYRYYRSDDDVPEWRSLQPHYFGQYIHDSGFWYAVWSLDNTLLLDLPLQAGQYYLEFSHRASVLSADGDTLTASYETPDGLPFGCYFSVAEPQGWSFADSMRSFVCLDSQLQGYPDTLILWDRGSGDGTEPYFHRSVPEDLREGIPVCLENIVCRTSPGIDTCTYYYRIYDNCAVDTPGFTPIPMRAESTEKRRADNLQIDLCGDRKPGNYRLEMFGCISKFSGIWNDQLDLPSDDDIYTMTYGIYDAESAGQDVPLPIELSLFDLISKNGSVILNWETAAETENRAFRIYRNDEMIKELEGAGNSSEPRCYRYTDSYVIPGKTYTYVLADVGMDNRERRHRDMARSVTLDEGNAGAHFFVGPAYPNPFNPRSCIPLNLAEAATVCAVLYDVSGRPVQILTQGWMNAGSHSIRIDGSELGAGIYMVNVTIADKYRVQKIVLMK